MHMGGLIMYMGFYLFYLYYDSLRLTSRSTCPVFGLLCAILLLAHFLISIKHISIDRQSSLVSFGSKTFKDPNRPWLEQLLKEFFLKELPTISRLEICHNSIETIRRSHSAHGGCKLKGCWHPATSQPNDSRVSSLGL